MSPELERGDDQDPGTLSEENRRLLAQVASLQRRLEGVLQPRPEKGTRPDRALVYAARDVSDEPGPSGSGTLDAAQEGRGSGEGSGGAGEATPGVGSPPDQARSRDEAQGRRGDGSAPCSNAIGAKLVHALGESSPAAARHPGGSDGGRGAEAASIEDTEIERMVEAEAARVLAELRENLSPTLQALSLARDEADAFSARAKARLRAKGLLSPSPSGRVSHDDTQPAKLELACR